MALSDIFRSFLPAQQVASAHPAQQANQAVVQGQVGSNVPGNLPTGQTSSIEQPGQGAPTLSPQNPVQTGAQTDFPLPNYDKLWENIPSAEGSRPAINADRTKIDAVAKTVDFTKNLPQPLVQKALAGDQSAFLAILNQAMQEGFATAMQASSHLVDKQSSAVIDHMQTALPNQIRNAQSKDSLLTAHPQFASPAIQPLLSVITQQLAAQYPTATSADITAHAIKYLQSVAKVVSPGQVTSETSGPETFATRQQQKKQAADKFDWGEWAIPE